MQDFDFYMPQTLKELASIMKEKDGQIVAGGTDVIPGMRRGLFSTECLVDASYIDDLRFIEDQGTRMVIGALTTHQEIVESPVLQETIPSLVEAASTIGCHQTRHRGTLGGNIANASPAADTIPALLTYDAEVRLIHSSGERTLPLDDFLEGPGKTGLERGEIIHSISFVRLKEPWGTAFIKLGLRKGMAISVANAAAALVLDGSGKIADARLALGSVAPTVVRSPGAEALLAGQEPVEDVFHKAAEACLAGIAPISDVRSTEEYRRHSTMVLARRVLATAAAQAKERRSS